MAAQQPTRPEQMATTVLIYGVGLHGLIMIAASLEDQLHVHFSRYLPHINGFVLDVPILLGLTLLYLSLLLRRRKQLAWTLTLALYAVIFLFNILQAGLLVSEVVHPGLLLARNIALPVLVVAGLVLVRKQFTVRSDVRNFASSLRFVALILLVALAYGVSGFLLLDTRDFHQSISLPQAVQRTVDQFDITTPNTLHPYTRRAKLFVDSLSVVSAGALVYAAIALFQPIRARLYDHQSRQRELAASLLHDYPASSEDFFKLWPHDKLYFFNLAHNAGLAYAVHRGVALVVGDPFGSAAEFPQLLASFDDFCRTNDWAIGSIHTEPHYTLLYKHAGFSVQKIGEEASLNLSHFDAEVKNDKYFRQIGNKFTKQGYASELLRPPHSQALVQRLHHISDEWLTQPGRSEFRFLLGYFSPAYLQQCPVMVLRDEAGTIQAFLNQVPSFDPKEANFDMLRHTKAAAGNANDFLLMEFIEHARAAGFERLNLGLCPLTGLGAHDQERSVIGGALRFLYANGDRLYSFSGLYRFKAKYEPQWSSRYIAYRGGIRGFSRVLSALGKATKY